MSEILRRYTICCNAPQSVSTGQSAGTLFAPHCCLNALKCAGVHWTGKLAARILIRLIMQCGGHCSRWCIIANRKTGRPDLNLVDYAVWGALQQMVYRRKISDIDQLKHVLIDCLAQLSQDTLNRAIDQLPKRLMMVIKAKGAHAEFRLD